MNINRNELKLMQHAYQSMLTESHDETGSVESHDESHEGASTSTSKQLKQKLFQDWKQLILGAVQRGELSEGLAARNIDSIVDQMWSDTQAVLDHTWEQGQEAYADMSAHYEQEDKL